MVKALSLGLLVAIMCCGIASGAPAHAPQVQRRETSKTHTNHPEAPYHYYEASNFVEHFDRKSQNVEVKIEEADENDNHSSTAARSERSANLSHTSGSARKIQIFIKNFHLQVLPDGSVNGTLDDNNIYTILQRTAVGIGKLKIQGVATCQYLCMDACGLLYGSREFNDECVFNEMIQQHHYNTYSSTKYSNDKRTSYLAFNRRGNSRKVLLHAGQPLGRLSSFTRVLTRTVPQQKVEELQHPMRHHAHMCAAAATKAEQSGKPSSTTPRCRKHKKRKKKRRKCQPHEAGTGTSDDSDGDQCHNNKRQQAVRKSAHHDIKLLNASFDSHSNISFRPSNNSVNASSSNKCETDDSNDECQRVESNKKFVNATKTNKFGDKMNGGGTKKKKGINKQVGGLGGGGRKRLKTTQTPLITTTNLIDDSTDDDYGIDSTTTFEWDDSTMMPLPDETGPHHPD